MKLELALDTSPFVRTDEPLVGIADGVERPVKLRLPEAKELVHLRKIRCEIIVLLDVGLQDGFEIGNAVEDMRGGQPITVELTL